MTSYVLVEGVHYTRDGRKVTLIKFPEMPAHERVAIYDGNEHVCGTCPVNTYGEPVAWDQAHPKERNGRQ